MTRQLLGWKLNGPPTCLQAGGKTILKQKDIANTQARYYKDKIDRLKEQLPRVRSDPLKLIRRAHDRFVPDGTIPKLVLKQTNQTEILKIIMKLKSSHTYGRDGIDGQSIKLAGKLLAEPITFVVNLSLGTNHFPSKWKLGRVCPLLKSNDADTLNPASYRPMTQLPLISKLAWLLEEYKHNVCYATNHGYDCNKH